MKRRYHPIKDNRPFYFYGEFSKEETYRTDENQIACVAHNGKYYFGNVKTDKEKSGSELGVPSEDNFNWRLPQPKDFNNSQIQQEI